MNLWLFFGRNRALHFSKRRGGGLTIDADDKVYELTKAQREALQESLGDWFPPKRPAAGKRGRR